MHDLWVFKTQSPERVICAIFLETARVSYRISDSWIDRVSPFRHYFVRTVGAVVICIGSAIGFNMMIDPYNLTGYGFGGFSDRRAGFLTHDRLAKLLEVRKAATQTIILGNSKAEHGIDVNDPAMSPAAAPRYNFALGYASEFESAAYLRFAHAHAPLSTVVFGADFLSFMQPKFQRGFDLELLSATGPEFWVRYAGKVIDSYLSVDALLASVKALSTEPSGMLDVDQYGATTEAVFTAQLTKSDGYWDAFERKTIDRLEEARVNALSERERLAQGAQTIRKMVEFCEANGITLYMFIVPSHAIDLELISETGRWESFEDWKRSLVKALRTESGRTVRNVVLWDFSGYNSVTTERIPGKGQLGEMTYYWEPTHFTKRVGALVLARMFGRNDLIPQEHADFGTALSEVNIESHLGRIRTERDRYRSLAPAELTRTYELTRAAHLRFSK